jgi:hypothetical protein
MRRLSSSHFERFQRQSRHHHACIRQAYPWRLLADPASFCHASYTLAQSVHIEPRKAGRSLTLVTRYLGKPCPELQAGCLCLSVEPTV